MSKKYIIKNCPSFNDGHPNLRFCGECLDLMQTDGYINDCCIDRTDCLLKRIVEKCKEDCIIFGDKELRYDTLDEILDMFEIEECE